MEPKQLIYQVGNCRDYVIADLQDERVFSNVAIGASLQGAPVELDYEEARRFARAILLMTEKEGGHGKVQ